MQNIINKFDRTANGSLFDRGSADAWYSRKPKPHWFPLGTYKCDEVFVTDPAEVAEYMAGYNGEKGRKEW